MRKLISILVLFFVCLDLKAQIPLTPISYSGFLATGAAQTNTLIFTPYPYNQPFYAVGTNIVSLGVVSVTPNSSGYFSNNMVPITYAVTISNSPSVGFFVTIPNTTTYTPLAACMTSSPIVQFISSTFGLITNWLGYFPATNSQAGIISALGFTPPTNSYAGISNSLGFGPATNTQAGLINTLLYAPAGSNYNSIVNALGFSPTNLPSGQIVTNAYLYGGAMVTNGALQIVWSGSTNLLSGTGYTNIVSGNVVSEVDSLGNATFAGIVRSSNGLASWNTNHLAAFSSTAWTNTNAFNVAVSFPAGVTNVTFSNSAPYLIETGTNPGIYSRNIGPGWEVTNSTALMSVSAL